ncbi:MAG TPA: V-type ATP synthase subunit E family protein [Candidatus Nanoarchaeia archaeon]|nr:V-type ATP synthase subunit E family protein [Candidatus Nanoarchaeia archaeon]
MGIAEVKKQIVEEAQQQAKLVLSDAHAEVKRIEHQTAQQLKDYEKQLKDNAERMIAAAKRKEIAAAEFEGKRMLLDSKKEMIEKAVANVEKHLSELPQAERKKMLVQLLKCAARELDVKTVYLNKDDVSLVTEKGIDVRADPIEGGMLAENSDGTISIDLSFKTLLEQAKQEHLQQLSEVLFS